MRTLLGGPKRRQWCPICQGLHTFEFSTWITSYLGVELLIRLSNAFYNIHDIIYVHIVYQDTVLLHHALDIHQNYVKLLSFQKKQTAQDLTDE